MRIFTWNINGLRSIWKKGFKEWVQRESPDIICLQETRLQEEMLEPEMRQLACPDGGGNLYCCHFFSAERKGYSGVATYSKTPPLRVKKGFDVPHFDIEGRVLQTDFEKFSLINVYFPNGGRNDERLQYKLDFYDALFFHLERLRKKQKSVIVCGDYNTAHKEIDLANPEEWGYHSGFLPVERQWIDQLINLGYIDVFREYNQQPGQYTYWDPYIRARERNFGWRIDYFLVTREARELVTNAKIHMDVMGSDHCPVELQLKI